MFFFKKIKTKYSFYFIPLMTNGIRLSTSVCSKLFIYLLLLEQRQTSTRGKAINLAQTEPYPIILKNEAEPLI